MAVAVLLLLLSDDWLMVSDAELLALAFPVVMLLPPLAVLLPLAVLTEGWLRRRSRPTHRGRARPTTRSPTWYQPTRPAPGRRSVRR